MSVTNTKSFWLHEMEFEWKLSNLLHFSSAFFPTSIQNSKLNFSQKRFNNFCLEPNSKVYMQKLILFQKADIGLAPLVVMTDRAEYVDFTVPFYDYVGISLLMRTKEATNDYFLFFKVYQLPAWGLLGGLFLFVVVGMYFFERVSPHSYRNNKHINDPTHTHFGVLNCVWYCLMLWAPQGMVHI